MPSSNLSSMINVKRPSRSGVTHFFPAVREGIKLMLKLLLLLVLVVRDATVGIVADATAESGITHDTLRSLIFMFLFPSERRIPLGRSSVTIGVESSPRLGIDAFDPSVLFCSHGRHSRLEGHV